MIFGCIFSLFHNKNVCQLANRFEALYKKVRRCSHFRVIADPLKRRKIKQKTPEQQKQKEQRLLRLKKVKAEMHTKV